LASSAADVAPQTSSNDAEIRATLLGEVAGHKWSYVGHNVVVRDGIIHLWGSIWSADEIRATRVAAEGIPGVKGIEEHIDQFGISPGI